MEQSLNVGVAFVTGIASFIAPCTLALVPAYLAYLAGYTLTDQRSVPSRRQQAATVLNVALFAVGFTSVFVVLGSSLGALSSFAGDQAVWLNRIGGLLIIGFGLVALGLLRVPMLERGFVVDDSFARRLRYAGSLLVGGTFAVGWIPCVGPILGGILVLAATTGSAGSGAVLLTAYSLGIMAPFVLAGVFFRLDPRAAAAPWASAAIRNRRRRRAHDRAGRDRVYKSDAGHRLSGAGCRTMI